MNRLLALNLVFTLFVLVAPARSADDDDDDKKGPKEALQALNDFIGSWKGTGGPEKARPEPKETWREAVSWSWRFKGDDAWLVMAVKEGRYFKNGELRYLPLKKHYQLTAKTVEGNKLVFVGDLKDEILVLERVDSEKKETQRIKMNLAAEGIRFIYRVEHKPAGRTVFYHDYQVAFTKEGESFAAKQKKVECVVSGGLGTIPVSFKGTTYYVCCSGCRDAFMENPEKYIKEYEAKKAGKK